MIGQKIDNYEIIEQLGEGGMAVVYRAKHLNLPRDVAIKVLHPHLSSKERNRNRFSREAQAIELLDHPNILKILDYSGKDVDCSYIIMELIRGPNLKEILVDRKKIPSEVVALIGIHLCKALQYAHEKNLVHRDLKPENVMLSREGVLKLTDFGIARFLDDVHVTITGALVGSPAYMSPEQAKDLSVDSRSDLFSLGILLYHLVCGQLPFSGSNPSIILRNIIENNFIPPNEVAMDISISLSNVIHTLLKIEPEERPQQAKQIIPMLEECLFEAGMNPQDEAWSLKMWISDPDSYEERLTIKLESHLVQKATALIEEEQHLLAQPILNRILSINPESEETMMLIQQFHSSQIQAVPSTNERTGFPSYAIPILIAAVLGIILWPTVENENLDSFNPVQLNERKDILGRDASTDKENSKRDGEPSKNKLLSNTASSISSVNTEKNTISNEGNEEKTAIGQQVEKNTTENGDKVPLHGDIAEGEIREGEIQEGEIQEGKIQAGKIQAGKIQESVSNKIKKKGISNNRKTISKEMMVGLEKSKKPNLEPKVTENYKNKTIRITESDTKPTNPQPENFALVTVTVPSSWADIYIDGEKKGRTGQIREIRIVPGNHELRLENDFAIPYIQKFTISPGESRIIEVTSLQKKPSTLVIPATYDQQCFVSLQNTKNGNTKQNVGTLETINYQLTLSEPTFENVVELNCGEEIVSKKIKPHQPGSTIPLP